MGIDELQELVLGSYAKHLDIDIAFLKHAVSDEDREVIEADEVFRHRIALIDADLQEELISDLLDLKRSSLSDSVRLNAIRDLGQLFYAKRFKETKQPILAANSIMIYLPEKDGD